MMPLDATIHPGTDTAPEMVLGTLYDLLRIAARDKTCNEVCYQGPQKFPRAGDNDSLWSPTRVERLTLNELIAKAMPVFKTIDGLYAKINKLANEKHDAIELNMLLQADVRRLRSDLDRINDIINPE